MLEYLKVIAESWPIAVMVIGVSAAIVVRRSLRQAMNNSAEIQELRASSALVVRNKDE